MVCLVYSLESPRWGDSNEYTQHTFHDKIRKFSYFFFLSYRKNFGDIQNQVRISHGKQAISVRAIESRLYQEGYFYARVSRFEKVDKNWA